MTIQTLISTMHRKDYAILEQMNVSTPAVVINQCDIEGRETITHRGHEVLWINTTERGLSKSRNMAIKNATADICVLADDDIIYEDGYGEAVLEAFRQCSDADIIGFEVFGIERKWKIYKETKPTRVGILRSMKLASVEMGFRRKSVVESGITFNERIGAGTKYLMGEENAFLFHCMKKGLCVWFQPVHIANLHMDNSCWFPGWTEEYFIGRGAAFTAMDKNMAYFLILQWAIRKYKRYKNDMGIWRGIQLMCRGSRLYRKEGRK